jgi:hypothetical protein
VEHEDNAKTMGRLAGQAMAGRTVTYDHLPSFYSDLFELGYEAVWHGQGRRDQHDRQRFEVGRDSISPGKRRLQSPNAVHVHRDDQQNHVRGEAAAAFDVAHSVGTARRCLPDVGMA